MVVRRSVRVALLVTLVASGTACSGAKGSTIQAEDGDVTVSLVGLRFEPATVTVPVGRRVVWTWTDRVGHNVVADDAAFKPSKVQSGGTYVIRFDRSGTYRYQCTLHEGMRGTVTAT